MHRFEQLLGFIGRLLIAFERQYLIEQFKALLILLNRLGSMVWSERNGDEN